MTGVCVGPGFVVNPDGSLGISGPRNVAWPYGTGSGCQISAINGLKLDQSAGKLWVEPSDLQNFASNIQSTYPQTPYNVPSTATSVSPAPAAFTVTNPDTCRPTVLTGNAVATLAFTGIAANATPSIYAGLYTGTPPATATLRKQYTNGLSTTAAWTESVSLPLSYVIPAGGSVTVTPLLQISLAGAGGQYAGYFFEFEGATLTQRTVL